jgi:uncharacterized tellurite resistance protein B-like protein
VSIRSFLGIPDQHTASADTETVRKVIEALDQMDPSRARFIAAFGYILSRVANADLTISPEEVHAMERIVMERGGLPEEQALIVIQTAKTRAQLFGGTENFLVAREFSRIATREEKLALLDCLFAVAAAEGGISATEDNEIRQIVNELGLGHPDFIAVRSRWKDQLNVLKRS